jgi:hypothetical protein
VHVENDVKQAKDLGLNDWPSRHWTINVTWTQIIALATNLLACYRQLVPPTATCATPPRNCCATALAAPRKAHPRATQTVAAPTRGLALDQRPDQHLAGGHSVNDQVIPPGL